jgi:hypothetical protein
MEKKGGRATFFRYRHHASANSDGWKTRAQFPLFLFFFSETEGAVRRGQKDEKVENQLFVIVKYFFGSTAAEVGNRKKDKVVSLLLAGTLHCAGL